MPNPTHKPSASPQDFGLKSFIVPHEGHIEVVFKGPFGGSVRAAFDQAYSQLKDSFPILIVLNLTKISNAENKRGINALADFVLSLRQKGNSLRFVGLCRALGEPLMALNLVLREELGDPQPGSEIPKPVEAPIQVAKTKTRTKSKTKIIEPGKNRSKREGNTRTIEVPRPAATRTGISLMMSNTQSLEIEGRPSAPKLPAALPPAPKPLPEIPKGNAHGVRELLERKDSEAGKQLWNLFEESPLLILARGKGSTDEAELLYLSKDRTHALFVDRGAHTGNLSQKTRFLFAQQCARLVVDAEFALVSASIILLVPAGSAANAALLATFDETYKMPSINLTRGVFSACRIQGRASRLSRNICRYPVAITYKEQKLEISLTVKIIEMPASFFE